MASAKIAAPARPDVPSDGAAEGLQQRRRAPDPVGQGGTVEIDPLALEDLVLSMQMR